MVVSPEILDRLRKSKFRSSFKLDEKDIFYIKRVSFSKIEEHAEAFIREKLAPLNPKNDGKQTPFKGHPVFKAQHATATCCRDCLLKWYNIPKERALKEDEIIFIKKIVIYWIKNRLPADFT